ncbi:peptidoglycan-binding domain-containing protein [Actinoplanes sp. NPDC051851]|uniref:peptidoglycan-binding domain-containing protein n=1 Tax=Actinoplanes sp. NPDC051851 TaxID=3154753 RepID=UPI00341503E6
MKSIKAIVGSAAVLGAVVAGAVLPASAASAATPSCTKAEAWSNGVLVPVSSGGKAKCSLVKGANNAAVGALQLALKICYSQSITVDNSFGTNTFNALKAAQTTAKIGVDGSYGPESAANLKLSWYGDNPTKADCHVNDQIDEVG